MFAFDHLRAFQMFTELTMCLLWFYNQLIESLKLNMISLLIIMEFPQTYKEMLLRGMFLK